MASTSMLHTITSVRPPAGAPLHDTGAIGAAVLTHFSAKWPKWRCTDAMSHERVDSLLGSLGAAPPAWTEDKVAEAVSGLRRPSRVDSSGLCASALQLVTATCPSAVTNAVRQIAAGAGGFGSLRVRGVALGKKSAAPSVTKVRMLLPLCVCMWMCVLDVLLASSIHAACQVLPPLPTFW